MWLFGFFKKEASNVSEEKTSKIIIPNFPERFSTPIPEIRKRLKGVLIDDFDNDDNPIKRHLENEEINKFVSHWKDMIKYSKEHFKGIFDSHIMQSRPFLQFSSVKDSRSCTICNALNEKVMRNNDPRAVAFFPPLHIGCRCGMVTLSAYDLEQEGLRENCPDIALPDMYSLNRLFIRRSIEGTPVKAGRSKKAISRK